MSRGSAVAVVGLACRLPGALGPEEFWALLRDGREAVGDTPPERWALWGLESPADELPGLGRGGYLDQVDRFDAGFFGVSPREAVAMDPQQRLVLELCWEALEDAGVGADRLAGSQAGVFVGAISSEYGELLERAGLGGLTRHAFTGTERAMIANRVSYFLGLDGPSLTVDTGQSSGLVSVYLACESLRSGESAVALAGGVNLNLGLSRGVKLERLGALSPDGHCFTFDARANGFVRGEGGGVVALKLLDRALEDGDRIYCVIRGGAVNNDGGGDGLTAPDQGAQEQLLRLAYERAGIDPGDVQFVELHGTGTPLGDRVEAGALGAVLGGARGENGPLLVGSAKTNVGHLEAAAGTVGLIKAALALRHGEIPASLNFEQPSPAIALDELRLQIQQSSGAWPEVEGPRLAGVSSFGIGGTNCHLVLEQAPAADRGDRGDGEGVPPIGVVPWVLSARTESGLAAQSERLAGYARQDPELRAGDVGYSLATTRQRFAHRAVVVGDSREQLLDGLDGLLRGTPTPNVLDGVAGGGAPRVAFVFPGQGSQWVGMGVELMEHSPVFADAMRDCLEALSPHLDFSLEGVLRGDPGAPALEGVGVIQPALFAVMVSLARLWESVGVLPAAVVGHSQGEIAAAHIAGGLSLDDAARVVALRSRALESVAGRGGMVSVGLSAGGCKERFGSLGDRVWLAAINGPESTVVSGEPAALEELLERCEAEGIRARRIPVDYASHSPQVEAVREHVLEALASISPHRGEVSLYSTLTGELIDTAGMDAEYWYRGLRHTVQFEPAVRGLLDQGYEAFLEMSPHPVLTMAVQATAEAHREDPERITVVGSLRRDDGGPARFLSSLAQAHVRGVEVDWEAYFAGSGARRVGLPTYAFQRERYWVEGASGAIDPAQLTAGESEASSEPEAGDARGPSLAQRLAGMSERERSQTVLDLVLAHVAFVLGHASPQALEPGRAFKELGFDSPGAVELRNRLSSATGLKLPASLTFDHPSASAVSEFLLAELTGSRAQSADAQLPQAVDEPLAIVGMACRLPGGVSSPEELWELLEAGGDAIGEFPTNRGWDLEGLFDPDPDHAGTSYTRHGGFLYDAGEFDPEHFSISPREALAMDPQQRLLLEVAWEALEQAGIDPHALRGSQTGVFAGAYDSDYGSGHGAAAETEGLRLTGGYLSVISGRLAYVLGLEGPAVSVDTACSSSLVALHLAGQALRSGECSLALAGGVSVIASPKVFVDLSRQRALSPDGRCRAFGAGANGTGFSDGVGMVVLERLSDARRNGHRVLAVVKGSATNQDGASNGLTAPNGPSQERVIRRALAMAGVQPGEVDVVEAHGTGTSLGDPIEAGALMATYGQARDDGPLYLGSVKSNIGHTQAAAGVAGVIKMVLALEHGVLPRTLYVEEPSPHVDWEADAVRLLSEPVPWTASEGRPRRAGVSSFGISGTNAHVILEEAPAPVQMPATHEPVLELGAVHPFLVSGSSADALRGQAGRLGSFVQANPELDLPATASKLALERASLSHRAVALAGEREELVGLLAALERGEPADGLVRGVVRPAGGVVFVFPGQASQWVGMGGELMERSPVFARAMRECIEALSPHVDFALEAVLRGGPDAPALEGVEVIHPALLAVMVSLARLWESVGVRPDAVVGHSLGEIAAAHIAGGLSLDDAARVVTLRARALAEVAGGDGAMLSVAVSADQLVERLGELDETLYVGVVNGPGSVVLSGGAQAVQALLARCEAQDIRARVIADVASHSPFMEAIRERVLESMSAVVPRSGSVPLYSTVTGGLLDTALMGAEHWYRGLSQTVVFDRAIRGLVGEGFGTFIEVSPHPVLTVAVQGIVDEESQDPERVAVLGSLRRDDGGPDRFLASLAQAHTHGTRIDWGTILDRGAATTVQVPTYAFQHGHYWLAPGAGAANAGALGLNTDEHALIGAMVPVAGGDAALFTARLSLDDHPWLADHAVIDMVLFPGAGFLELALHAAQRLGYEVVEELTLASPLVLNQRAVQVQVSVAAPDAEGRRELWIYSREEGDTDWTEHARGVLGAGASAAAEGRLAQLAAEPWPPEGSTGQASEFLYDRLAELGYQYGPAFQGLRETFAAPDALYAEVALDDERAPAAERFGLHPALSDAALQAAALRGLESSGPGEPQIPFSFSGVRLYSPGSSELRVRVSSVQGGSQLTAIDDTGAPVLSIESVHMRPLDRRQLGSGGVASEDGLFALRWVELGGEAAGTEPVIAILGESGISPDSPRYRDLNGLEQAVANGEAAPEVVLAEVPAPAGGDALAPAARELTERTLELLKRWLGSELLAEARLVVVTRAALAVRDGDVPDLAAAAVPGLVRSAHSEHPDRFGLVDLDGSEPSREGLAAALLSDEPEVAIRDGSVFVPRVARPGSESGLVAPVGEQAWCLAIESPGTLDHLVLRANPAARAPLGPGQVRLAVRAAGLNFRDVAVALGLVSLPGIDVGVEGAGVVLEVAPDVDGLAVGDRVMGLISDAFGPVAVADHRQLVEIPAAWSFEQAASVPAVFLTAYLGLVDVAGVRPGESVLVHAAAGGVGMAAVQLARHLGAEVFATAHPDKWDTLRGMGIEDSRIASSRTGEFEAKFRAATGGRGVDVVLGSLAGELVDKSLRLLAEGGRYAEMGKTDIRDPGVVATEFPGARYQAFDLMQTPPERVQEMLAEVVALFERGVLRHLPISSWDVRRGRDAFRFLRESRHTGKIVLRVPRRLEPGGTVLITGGTGGLGALQARRLAARGEAGHLLLVSRRGPQAPGAAELVAELEELGCTAEAVACDVSDRAALQRILAGVPPERPLTAVVHAAGVLDDGVIASLDAERLRRVMAPKVDAAVHLHELTEDLEVSEFVLYSSAAATLGSPGQGNYAAANAFLDALAALRRTRGLPAVSLAFGVWERATGMSAHLAEGDKLSGGPMDLLALEDEQGLELIDLARGIDQPQLLPMRLDFSALRARARANLLPAIMSELVRVPKRATAAGGAGSSLARTLAAAAEAEREEIVVQLVRTHAAAVLGHDVERIERKRPFKELGFDSLSSVELRNRLAQATGLKLPATLLFDHPTPVAVAKLLRAMVEGEQQVAKSQPALRRSSPVDEPLAIVGMACRYPGGVSSPEELWELLDAGGDAIGEFPTDRGWDLERLFDPDPDHAGTSYLRRGGFLYDAAQFDAEHFSISPREALAMDPQQRLLLEVGWEALEVAGIDPHSLRGSQTGVFAGVVNQDYGSRWHEADVSAGYALTGNTISVVSGRLAYVLGLEGPAVSVDTACSSSLVALHLAAQAVRGGECSLALVGGVTVMANPGVFVEFSRQRGLAPDGRCKAFGAGADGTVFSDGVGALVLERLSDARRAGHPVLAVLRGSATNQDGASNGLTAPNGPSQERVIRQALAVAGVEPGDVDVVEAHGTGTSLGDPIEAGALMATYGQDRAAGPLWLGSVKSNIGHTQAASGVAGVIKMVLAMQRGELPRTLYAEEPSPHIDWEAAEVRLLSAPVPWPAGERPRRAAVSSFGISGTNAHVILEEAPALEAAPAAPEAPYDGPIAWLVSGRTEAALAGQAERLHEFVTARPELDLRAAAVSLATTRARLEHRAAIIGRDREKLLDGLAGIAGREPRTGVVQGMADGGKTAFMFTGQGAQRVGMGRGLREAFPAFARAFDEVCAEFDRYLERPLAGIVFADQGSPGAELLYRTEFTQPALFALEVALFRLLEGFEVKPDFLIGHSIGEIAAAHVAGVFSLEDACRLVAARGRLMGALPEGGAMLAAQLSQAEAEEAISGWADRVSLAAINAPEQVVFSGDGDAIEELRQRFEADGVRARQLRVSHAFHSARMEPMLKEFLNVAETIEFKAPALPIVSNLTGKLLDEEDACSPHYWVRHVREAVRFAAGIATLNQAGVTRYLELGPAGVLSAMAGETLESVPARTLTVPVLQPKRDESESLVTFLARADGAGVHVDWRPLLGPGRQIPLPTYAFQHRHYWLASSSPAGDARSLGQAAAEHALLGAMVRLAGGKGALFTGRLSLEDHPWLADHTVMESVVFPASGFLDLALHAAAQTGAEEVGELVLDHPLVLDERESVQLQVSVGAADAQGRREISIHSRVETAPDDEWTLHAGGWLGPALADPEPARAWEPDGLQSVSAEEVYAVLGEHGVALGPAFAGLASVSRGPGEVLASAALPAGQQGQAGAFGLHPALATTAFAPAAVGSGIDAEVELVPTAWRGVRLHRPGASALRVQLVWAPDAPAVSAALQDEGGETIASIREVVFGAPPAPARSLARDSLFTVQWRPVPLTPQGGEASVALVMPQTGEVAAPLAPIASTVGVHRDLGTVAHSGDKAPELVLVDFCTAPAEPPEPVSVRARTILHDGLALVQQWLSDERFETSRLVVVTQGAVEAQDEEGVGALAAAPLWGLIRSAQFEHPDRFVLIDVDELPLSTEELLGAVGSGEPQLARRSASWLVPRAQWVTVPRDPEMEGHETVMITGGTGGVGGFLARHLVIAHGVRHLVLTSRSGADAPGARDLQAELEALGAEVSIRACDVSDRSQLSAVLQSIPDEHPLTGIVHAAGVSTDAMITSLTPEMVDYVLPSKLDAGLLLDELTAHLDLKLFAMCSSAFGLLGARGAANYSAANVFLDALVAARRARGQRATSLAWGMWADTGLATHLGQGDPDQLLRRALLSNVYRSLSPAEMLELFDSAIAVDAPVTAILRIDRQALATAAAEGVLPRFLDELTSVPLRGRAEEAPGERLTGGEDQDPRELVFDLVRTHLAVALGYDAPEALDMSLTFMELGIDSLVATELRRRIHAATGLELPPKLVFELPSPLDLIDYVRSQLEPEAPAEGQPPDRVQSVTGVTLNGNSARNGDRGVDGVDGVDSLTSMFVQALELERVDEGMAIVEAASRLRPVFGSESTLDHVPRLVPLAGGTSPPTLFCFPTIVATGGPHEYTRFAKSFGGRREIVAVPAPGFGSDEPLPASVQAAISAQAEAIRRYGQDGPVVLVGYSTGGLLAYAAARRCMELGLKPAVVLIDTYVDEGIRLLLPAVCKRMADPDSAGMELNDRRLTAMGSYLRLLTEWQRADAELPTLLVQASDRLSGLPTNGGWQASWNFPHAAVAVAGDHFTLMEDHAELTAAAVQRWLTEELGW